MHIFEALVGQDDKLRPKPGLATSWTLLEDASWEFKLRPNVVFQNGAPFTAQDVIYSLCRVLEIKDSPSSFKGYLAGIKSVEAPDPLTLIIKTDAPNPQTPYDLSRIGVIPSQKPGVVFKPAGCGDATGPTRAAFDSGEKAVGAGPYQLVSFVRGQKLVLERNPSFWGDKPRWDRVEFNANPDDSQRVALLLTGDVDMIEEPGLQDLRDLSADPSVVVAAAPSVRVIYLALDQFQEPTPGVSGTNGKNPYKDRRVREAISKAIDRTAIVKQLLLNQATPVGQLLAPGLFGYNPGLEPVFDPAASKRLLAEAGYPDGFDLVLNGPNDRYIQDDKILGVVSTMLRAVGLRAVAKPETSNSFFERRAKFDFGVHLAGYGIPNADTALKQLVATRAPQLGLGVSNFGRYSNPMVDRLIAEALAVTNDADRDRLLQGASAAAMQDYAVIPLHAEKTSWALRKGLSYTARADQYTLAMEVKVTP